MAIYKTKNTRTRNGCEECRERREYLLGFLGIFWRILGNVIILTLREMFKNIPVNDSKDSGEWSKKFRRI